MDQCYHTGINLQFSTFLHHFPFPRYPGEGSSGEHQICELKKKKLCFLCASEYYMNKCVTLLHIYKVNIYLLIM